MISRPGLQKIFVYAPDFYPNRGGVADYGYNFSKQLQKNGLLEKVIANIRPSVAYDLPVMHDYEKNERRPGNKLLDNLFLFSKWNTLLHYGLLFIAAYRFIKKNIVPVKDAQVIITAYYDHPTGVFIRVCALLKIKYEIVFHGLDILTNLRTHPKLFVSNILNASLLITNSKATAKTLEKKIEQKLPPVYVLYPGLATEKIKDIKLLSVQEIEQKFGLLLGNKIILTCVARLIKRKGIDIVIKAMSDVVKVHQNIIFLIVGEGEEATNLHELIKAQQLEQTVFILGNISDVEKFSLLNISRIFVMPNKSLNDTDMEGFGISFIEALYSNNLVIGGTHGGAPEAIPNGEMGRKINFDEENSDKKLAEILQGIIPRLKDKASYDAAGRMYVSGKYDWSLLFDSYMKYKLSTQ
ncbi:MAG: glycosyltransferase family 4 protein [Bacteroidia bacterium]|nr:glycosyltransferase family 4 protein [Bacteroidia bacterium]